MRFKTYVFIEKSEKIFELSSIPLLLEALFYVDLSESHRKVFVSTIITVQREINNKTVGMQASLIQSFVDNTNLTCK